MENKAQQDGLSKYTVSFGLSLAIASVANGILVIAKEKSSAVMSGMARLGGHHWITHSILITGLFFLAGLVLAQLNGGKGVQISPGRLIGVIISGVAAGALLIAGFYLLGDG